MKKKATIILVLIVCIILVIGMIQISGLKQEIANLQNSLINQEQRIEEIYSNVFAEVNTMLEEENNQLTKSDWEYGGINVEHRTAEVICTVIPKEYTRGTTQVYLVCEGREYPMVFADDHFTATVEIPLFTETNSFLVKLVDGETVRTQTLDWILTPRRHVMPTPVVEMNGSALGTPGKEEYVWTLDETVTIDIDFEEKFQIQSVEIVTEIDGREVEKTTVDISAEGQHAYQKAVAKPEDSVPAFPEQYDSYYDGSAHFLYPLKRDLHIPNGSVMVLYVDVVDGNGLRYRCCLDALAIGENGEPDYTCMDENMESMMMEPIAIYDKAGNEIYKWDNSEE